ncbi:MAG: DUF3300 domain-containing protein [Verrucomicrobiota bacterium]
MKTHRATLLLASILGGFAISQAQPPPPPLPVVTAAPGSAPSSAPAPAFRTAEQLEQLLAPIALYPDALIALILPATTASTDIVLAARQLRENPNDRAQIEHRGWDESVKSLTSYPEVLQWLDQNLEWTKQVGEAFVDQPSETMQAVQRLRARARAAGTLVDTPQQQIIAESNVIRIVPAQPDIIYVPTYEPDVVFISQPTYYSRPYYPLITFGAGVRVGSWLAYDCDWHRRTIWVGDRRRAWHGHDWRRPLVPIAPHYVHTPPRGVHQWRPPPSYSRPSRTTTTVTFRSTEIVRPSPFGSSQRGSYNYNSRSLVTQPPSSRPGIPPSSSTVRTYTPTRRDNPISNPSPAAPHRSEPQRSLSTHDRTARTSAPIMGPVNAMPAPAPASPPMSTGTPSWQRRNTEPSNSPRPQSEGRRSSPQIAPSPQPAPAPATAPAAPAPAEAQPQMTTRPARNESSNQSSNSSSDNNSSRGSSNSNRPREFRNGQR